MHASLSAHMEQEEIGTENGYEQGIDGWAQQEIEIYREMQDRIEQTRRSQRINTVIAQKHAQ